MAADVPLCALVTPEPDYTGEGEGVALPEVAERPQEVQPALDRHHEADVVLWVELHLTEGEGIRERFGRREFEDRGLQGVSQY